MPRKDWTQQQRKEWGEKMRQARQAKAPTESVKPSEETTRDEAVVANDDDVAMLKKRIEELEKNQFFTQPVAQAVKAITKYSIDARDWPNPIGRLADEPKLQDPAF